MSSCAVELALCPKRTALHAKLHEPESPESECPILQDSIASASLDIMPRPFCSEHPTYKAMTLECGHTFHAIALVYHWARNGNVLCPVCRAGPARQRIALSRLPKEWKYSMATRVRRERKRDRLEEERHNQQLALQHSMVILPALELEIRIEVESGVLPSTWILKTRIMELHNSIIFDVPPSELRRIPYTTDTYMRLVPYTSMHLLPPSNWFKAGQEPGYNFSTSSDTVNRFVHIHLAMPDDIFAMLLNDMLMRRHGNGEGFHLLMIENDYL